MQAVEGKASCEPRQTAPGTGGGGSNSSGQTRSITGEARAAKGKNVIQISFRSRTAWMDAVSFFFFLNISLCVVSHSRNPRALGEGVFCKQWGAEYIVTKYNKNFPTGYVRAKRCDQQ